MRRVLQRVICVEAIQSYDFGFDEAMSAHEMRGVGRRYGPFDEIPALAKHKLRETD